MSFGRTSRGLSYEGLKEAIASALDRRTGPLSPADLEFITTVPTDTIPRDSDGKIEASEVKSFVAKETFTELELGDFLAHLKSLE